MANNRRARRSFIRGGRSVRETQWLELEEVAFSLPSANSAVVLLSLTTAEKALRPFTIMRTRGMWHIESDQTAATEISQVALGAAVVSDQASAIGVTAVPTPEIDKASDLWFLYESIISSFVVISAIGAFEPAGVTQQFDSKAMRKVEDGEDVVFVVENGALAADGAIGRLTGRVLIKLH